MSEAESDLEEVSAAILQEEAEAEARKEALWATEEEIKALEAKSTFCEACRAELPDLKAWEKHRRTKKHKENEERRRQEQAITVYQGGEPSIETEIWLLEREEGIEALERELHDLKTGTFSCTVCNDTFSDFEAFEKHQRSKKHKRARKAHNKEMEEFVEAGKIYEREKKALLSAMRSAKKRAKKADGGQIQEILGELDPMLVKAEELSSEAVIRAIGYLHADLTEKLEAEEARKAAEIERTTFYVACPFCDTEYIGPEGETAYKAHIKSDRYKAARAQAERGAVRMTMDLSEPAIQLQTTRYHGELTGLLKKRQKLLSKLEKSQTSYADAKIDLQFAIAAYDAAAVTDVIGDDVHAQRELEKASKKIAKAEKRLAQQLEKKKKIQQEIQHLEDTLAWLRGLSAER